MALSDAVTLDRVSRIVGYKLTKGNFSLTSPNLPHRIAILGEANDANQSTLSTAAQEVTSAQQAGNLYGYGSPIYHMMRILRPILTGDGVGGITTIVYPQAKASGATQKIFTVTAAGMSTGSGTHYLRLGGRTSQEGVFYAINVVAGDNAATIATKMAAAVNAVIGAPCLAYATGYEVIFTSKWSGLTANDLSATVDVGSSSLGITYSTVTVQAGSGTPSVQSALNLFANDWNTIVINPYTDTNTLSTLEAFNGIPSPDGTQQPTGRYQGVIMKPFIAITGNCSDDPSSITDSRLNDLTIAIAPAPLSAGLPMEAAANMAYLFALQAQNNPHLDVAASYYPDMPVPSDGNIGSMATYANRDTIVKKGCSTVSYSSGKYRVEDFVTTYHPVGENPPQYRYCRNLNVDWNVKYGYHILELANVVNHAIVNDTDVVTATNVVRPLDWKAAIDAYAVDLGKRALIAQPSFMQDSITVAISSTNPDRLETFFRYKRSGVGRILATTAQAGFNFGTV